MAVHACYLMKIDVLMDDVVPVTVLTNYPISVYCVVVDRCDPAFPVKPVRAPTQTQTAVELFEREAKKFRHGDGERKRDGEWIEITRGERSTYNNDNRNENGIANGACTGVQRALHMAVASHSYHLRSVLSVRLGSSQRAVRILSSPILLLRSGCFPSQAHRVPPSTAELPE